MQLGLQAQGRVYRKSFVALTRVFVLLYIKVMMQGPGRPTVLGAAAWVCVYGLLK